MLQDMCNREKNDYEQKDEHTKNCTCNNSNTSKKHINNWLETDMKKGKTKKESYPKKTTYKHLNINSSIRKCK